VKKVLLILGLLIVGLIVFLFFYLKPYVNLMNSKPLAGFSNQDTSIYFYIPSQSTYADVLNEFEKQNIITKSVELERVGKYLKYPEKIRAGKFKLDPNHTVYELFEHLTKAKPAQIKVTFNRFDTPDKISGKLGNALEVDSNKLISLLYSDSFMTEYGFDSTTLLTFFTSDTYFFDWAGNENQVLKRLINEYERIWNQENISKAKAKNLSKIEVSILATIVQEEVSKIDEAPKVAGLYLNRLQRNMKLEADPTIKYVIKDLKLRENVRRVYFKDLEIDHPYNSYKYTGLPPGPLLMPYRWAIEGVLNAEQHDYLFMVAETSKDRLGYHHFSKNAAEHQRYSAQYHQSLNQRGIR
jgi:UPF0755 protein